MIVEVYRLPCGNPTFERLAGEPTAIEVPAGSRLKPSPLGLTLFSPTAEDRRFLYGRTANEVLSEAQKGGRFRLVALAHR